MNKKRLLKLADLLERDASDKKGVKFNIDTLIDGPDGYTPGVDCGTTACALGLAALSGIFKRSGLTYEISKESTIIVVDGIPMYYAHAAARFFDISNDEAWWLFCPDYYTDKDNEMVAVKGARGERRVAKRIRLLVDGKADTDNHTI